MKDISHLSLQYLEKDYWSEPEYDSHLVTRCHELRKIPLSDFEIEDLRIIIGQGIGLKYLVPLAINELEKDIMAEGDMYPGDLLEKVAKLEGGFWEENPQLKTKLSEIIQHNLKSREDELLRILKQTDFLD